MVTKVFIKVTSHVKVSARYFFYANGKVFVRKIPLRSARSQLSEHIDNDFALGTEFKRVRCVLPQLKCSKFVKLYILCSLDSIKFDKLTICYEGAEPDQEPIQSKIT